MNNTITIPLGDVTVLGEWHFFAGMKFQWENVAKKVVKIDGYIIWVKVTYREGGSSTRGYNVGEAAGIHSSGYVQRRELIEGLRGYVRTDDIPKGFGKEPRPGEWIKIEDGCLMPEVGQKVFARDAKGDPYAALWAEKPCGECRACAIEAYNACDNPGAAEWFIGHTFCDDYAYEMNANLDIELTAWMPLPEVRDA